MVDATIVPVPKRGETPATWEDKPAKNRQKDKDARWTKKHGKSFFGYKNHVNADKTHKLIRDYEVTDAAVHDSRVLETLLDKANTSKDVFADSAYRSAEAEEKLAARGFRSRICVRGTRGRPLSKAMAANRAKSPIRARIEHVFGKQETAPGGRLARTIGIVRARVKIGLQNLVYNICRLATLERMAAA
jgi:IS5 family transposase